MPRMTDRRISLLLILKALEANDIYFMPTEELNDLAGVEISDERRRAVMKRVDDYLRPLRQRIRKQLDTRS